MSEIYDLSKIYEFFNPSEVDDEINIVGVGSVGSAIAEMLGRCGIKSITLWDFDDVESHNIVNQMFRQQDVGKKKVEAMAEILHEINPAMEVKVKPDGWNGEILSGYIFLAVDNIEIRKQIVESIYNSPYVEAVFDVRTLLTSAQHYAADWHNTKMKENLVNSMQFTHDEAMESAPVSACGITLGVGTVVRIIASLVVNNFINFVKEMKIKKFINIDCFQFMMDAF